jgi:hypothetical protein
MTGISKYPGNENRSNAARLCGFGGRFCPTESLWCIGSKICWANNLSEMSLRRIVCARSKHSNVNSLLTGSGFQWEVFSSVTEIPIPLLIGGTGLAVLDDARSILNVGYSYLRFCPQCIKNGFHSILWQFPIYSHCSVHRCALQKRCPTCGAILEYSLPSSPRWAFRCKCGAFLWRPRQSLDISQDTRRIVATKAEACTWLKDVILYSNAAVALREWVDAQSEVKGYHQQSICQPTRCHPRLCTKNNRACSLMDWNQDRNAYGVPPIRRERDCRSAQKEPCVSDVASILGRCSS